MRILTRKTERELFEVCFADQPCAGSEQRVYDRRVANRRPMRTGPVGRSEASHVAGQIEDIFDGKRGVREHALARRTARNRSNERSQITVHQVVGCSCRESRSQDTSENAASTPSRRVWGWDGDESGWRSRSQGDLVRRWRFYATFPRMSLC